MWPLALAPCWAFLVQSRTWLRSPQSLRIPHSSSKTSRRNLRCRASHINRKHTLPRTLGTRRCRKNYASRPLRTFLSKVPHSPCTLALPGTPRSPIALRSPVRVRATTNLPPLLPRYFTTGFTSEVSPNVKDEPRPQRARLVPRFGSRSVASFRKNVR